MKMLIDDLAPQSLFDLGLKNVTNLCGYSSSSKLQVRMCCFSVLNYTVKQMLSICDDNYTNKHKS